MNIDIEQRSSHDVPTIGGGETPPCVGLTSNALPEAQCRDLAESSQNRGVHQKCSIGYCQPIVQAES